MKTFLSLTFALSLFAGVANTSYASLIYSNDFDGGESFATGISGGFSGVVTTESVQGFGALAEFGGSFIRNTLDGDPAPASILSLSGLSAFQTVSLQFSLAIIDSWDGSSFPPNPSQAPDFFNVDANGSSIFMESFTNLTDLGGVQSYTGDALASEVHLGFTNGVNRQDSAYLINLSASADSMGSLVLSYFASGSGWVSPGTNGTDESWGIDNVSVVSTVPVPAAAWLFGSALIGMFGFTRRKKT